MVQWRCFKCQEDMVEAMVKLEFAGLEGSVEGISCPKCEAKYLLEETVMEKVREAEGEVSVK